MKHLTHFNNFYLLNEKITPITSNWFIINNESSFDKREEGGYLVFNQKGNFTILYTKKDSDDEEARIEFYPSKTASPDKKSMCVVKITTRSGGDRVKKSFEEISLNNSIEILAMFLDYSDLEKSDKEVSDRFIMGLSKAMKEVTESDSSDQLPSTYKAFISFLKQISNKSDQEIESLSSDESMKLEEIIVKFLNFFKKDL
jgi:hypothetical protein